MTTNNTETIIKYLKLYNEWRRGDEKMEQPNPTEIGKLIDEACEMLTSLERERDEAREQCGGIENMKLKLEIASVKNKLASVVSIARQGRYSAMDFVAVGKILDAMDDYLATPQHQFEETK